MFLGRCHAVPNNLRIDSILGILTLNMEYAITSGDVLVYLEILVAILLVVVLYNLLFVAVDLRKILKRFNEITEHVEDVIMKPLSMADSVLQWVMEYIESEEGKKKAKKGKKKSKAKKK